MMTANPLQPGPHTAPLNAIPHTYTVAGRGPLCIVIPGGPGMHAGGMGDLGGLTAFLTLLTLHPRGSGASQDAPDGDYSLPAYAADVAALLDHLGRDRAILLGHSHGGMIAQLFAATYPARVDKLILSDTAASLSDMLMDLDAAIARYRDQPWFADAADAIHREWAGDYQTAEEMGDLWLRELPLYFHQWRAEHEAWRATRPFLPVRLDPLRQFNGQEAPTLDLRPLLGRITAPTLVLVGASDFITTPAMAADIARHLPGAHLVVFSESGHLPFLEEPEAWQTTIRAFLQPPRDQRIEAAC